MISYSDLKEHFLSQWVDDDWALLRYRPKYLGPTAATNFILAFKRGEDWAVNMVAEVFCRVMELNEALLRQRFRCKYVLSVPPSTANKSNEPCERVCRAIARRHRWLEYLPRALVRVQTVPKSAYSKPGDRPNYEVHLGSIRYEGPVDLGKRSGVILIDDVITRGETARACRDLIKGGSGCAKVVGMYVGRTTYN